MLELYPQIKLTHITLALLSGSLFLLRGGAGLLGMRWPYHMAVKLASYTIDTALLTVAMLLLSILPSAYFANGWLVAKLGCIVIYIAFGFLALGRSRGLRTRALCYAAAIATYGMIYSIARYHHPLGIFQ
ncbi:MAG: SirB2 family protein [Candidatus Dactylopiibacterium sp.]|nr:SirB2 family protein [Candidatus Dactylopiibacterium sp.]